MPAVLKLLLLSSAACWLMANLPPFMFVLSIVWGIILLTGAYYLDRTKLLMMFLINVAILYVFSVNGSVFTALTLFGIPSLIMGLLLQTGRGYYELQKWGMITGLITVALFLAAAYSSLGVSGVDEINRQVESYIQESIQISRDSGLMDFYEERGISQEELEENVISMSRELIKYLPAFYALQAITMVFLVLFLSSYVARKRKMPILEKKPFREEIMPWQMAWVVIAGLALWLWGRNEMSAIYYVGANLLALALPVTVYYGTADLVYRIALFRPKNRKWVVGIFIALTFIFTLSAILFIGLLGLFDSLLDYRKIRKREE